MSSERRDDEGLEEASEDDWRKQVKMTGACTESQGHPGNILRVLVILICLVVLCESTFFNAFRGESFLFSPVAVLRVINISSKQRNAPSSSQSCVISPRCANITSRLTNLCAQHCLEPPFSGTFILSGAALTERSRLRGRVVGAVVKELLFRHNGLGVFIARYSLPRGTYAVSFELYYDAFDPEDFNATLPKRSVNFSTSIETPSTICPMSLNGVDGYWKARHNASITGLAPSYLMGRQPALAEEMSDLEYVFERCRLLDFNHLRRCIRDHAPSLPPQQLCLFGDSQARMLSHMLIDIIVPGVGPNNSYTSKDPLELNKLTPLVQYTQELWGDCFIQKTCNMTRLKTCTTMLINFGQWPAGQPGGFAWPVSRYATAVRAALLGARELFQTQRLIWLTTHPCGEVEIMYRVPPSEWRTDVVLRSYNEAAMEVLKELEFEYVDIFQMANVLHDLTNDTAHYKVPVEREIARIVLHTLCNAH